MSRRWILPAVVLILVFAASLIRVEPGTWGVLRGPAGGRSFVLDPGLRFRIPFFQRLASYPSGPFRLDFETEASSKEGSRVRIAVHFEGRLLRDALVKLSDRAAGRNGPTLVKDEVEGLLARWAADRSVEEIPSEPTEIRDRFREAARANGFEIRTFKIARTSGLGRSTGPPASPVPGAKVVLVGLDGADWQIIDRLSAAGEIPTLSRLKREGAWASLRSMQPMLSPLLWTTVATGKPPEEHGVVDFLVREQGTGRRVPVSSAARKVRALWNLFTEAGRTCAIVAWWATWPAEAVNGTLVSDRVAYSLFKVGQSPSLGGAVHPESYAGRIAKLRVGDEQITFSDLRPFVKITAEEYEAAKRRAASHPAAASRDPVIHLARVLASTRTYQALALDLLSAGQPDLLAVYYQGVDEVGHRFAHFADPKMEMVSDSDHDRYRGAVDAFYRYQDRLLGELLSKVDPSSLVLVVSDHGFRSGSARPRDQPPDIEGQPARWHRLYGIFLATGPMISPGRKGTVTLLDIAPIVLLAAGLPAAEDMPGAVPASLFDPAFVSSHDLPRIASYETGPRSPAGARAGGDGEDPASGAMIENLRALGYIGGGEAGRDPADTPGGAETAYSHANLAGIHLQKGRLEEAEKEAKRALKIAPGYLPALVYLAETYERQGRHREALPLARQAAAADSPDRQGGIYLLLANLYVAVDEAREGITDLSRFLPARGRESDLHSALGILKGAGGNPAGAEEEYGRALELDPAAHEPVKRLFTLYDSRREVERLVPILQAALRRDDQSAFHHNWLGLVLDRLGNSAQAEAAYRKALESEHLGAGVNLGNLLARLHRLDEAIPLFRQALEIDPRSLEARVGLGAALGIQGKTGEAIATLEDGLGLGLASPSLYNTLAMAYYEAKQRDKAIGVLKESLRLDPRQASARSLLSQWEKP